MVLYTISCQVKDEELNNGAVVLEEEVVSSSQRPQEHGRNRHALPRATTLGYGGHKGAAEAVLGDLMRGSQLCLPACPTRLTVII